MPFVFCWGKGNKVLPKRKTALFMSSHKRKKIVGGRRGGGGVGKVSSTHANVKQIFFSEGNRLHGP